MQRGTLCYLLREAVSGEYIPPEKPQKPTQPRRPAPKSRTVGPAQSGDVSDARVDASARVDVNRKIEPQPSVAARRAENLKTQSRSIRRQIRRHGKNMPENERIALMKRDNKMRGTLARATKKAEANPLAPTPDAPKQKPRTLNLPHTNEIKPTLAKSREMQQEQGSRVGRFAKRVRGEKGAIPEPVQQKPAVAAPTEAAPTPPKPTTPPPTPGTQPTGAPSPAPTLDKLGDSLKQASDGFTKFFQDPVGNTTKFLKNSPRARLAAGGLALGGALYAGHKLLSHREAPQRRRIATMESDNTDLMFERLFS